MTHLQRRTTHLALFAALGLCACGDDPGAEAEPPVESSSAGSAASGSGGGPASSSSSAATSGSGASGSGASGSGASGSGGSGAGSSSGMAELGTLVVLGDSISDGGGEAPFYYDLLVADLEAHYGHALGYENHAAAGSTTMALAGQIAELPAELTGPVAVAITSGGNNMQYKVLQILTGVDQGARDRMAGHIDEALAELLAPDRFGVGVEVRVFEANIYDASDGQGNFGSNGCAMPIDAPDGSAEFFTNWNAVIAAGVAAHAQTLIDFHGHFVGHGFNTPPPSWYADDCIHPNAAGHAEISHLFKSAITGQP
jgi:lysophospholipase L1-like esterase